MHGTRAMHGSWLPSTHLAWLRVYAYHDARHVHVCVDDAYDSEVCMYDASGSLSLLGVEPDNACMNFQVLLWLGIVWSLFMDAGRP